MSKNFDFGPLVEACEDYLEFIKSKEFHEDEMADYENAIMEKAMTAVHGDNVWEVINKIM